MTAQSMRFASLSGSFRAYFQKEFLESVRQSRYLILAVGFIFWAILSPLMLKLLPLLIQNQIPPELLATFKMNQLMAVLNYFKDLMQIIFLLSALTLMGIVSDETGTRRLQFPYSKGVHPAGIVLAKSVHYTLSVAILLFIGVNLNYYYTRILFKEGQVLWGSVVRSGMLFTFYYAFYISLLVFLGSLFRKPLFTALSVIIIGIIVPSLASIPALTKYLPYYLIQIANQLEIKPDQNLIPAIVITGAAIILLNILAIARLKKIEVVAG